MAAAVTPKRSGDSGNLCVCQGISRGGSGRDSRSCTRRRCWQDPYLPGAAVVWVMFAAAALPQGAVLLVAFASAFAFAGRWRGQ